MVPKCSALHLFACENTGAAIWAEDCQQENNIRGLLQVGCGAEGGLPFRLPRRCGSCRVSRQRDVRIFGFFQHLEH